MEVYKLEISFFDSSLWEHRAIEITAINKFQLIKTFLNETKYHHSHFLKRTQKDLWNENKMNIELVDLTFPIISEL